MVIPSRRRWRAAPSPTSVHNRRPVYTTDDQCTQVKKFYCGIIIEGWRLSPVAWTTIDVLLGDLRICLLQSSIRKKNKNFSFSLLNFTIFVIKSPDPEQNPDPHCPKMLDPQQCWTTVQLSVIGHRIERELSNGQVRTRMSHLLRNILHYSSHLKKKCLPVGLEIFVRHKVGVLQLLPG